MKQKKKMGKKRVWERQKPDKKHRKIDSFFDKI